MTEWSLSTSWEEVEKAFNCIIGEKKRKESDDMANLEKSEKFVSSIRMGGRPLTLPPLMSDERRRQCRHFREEAINRMFVNKVDVNHVTSRTDACHDDSNVENNEGDQDDNEDDGTEDNEDAVKSTEDDDDDEDSEQDVEGAARAGVVGRPRSNSYTLDEPSPVLRAFWSKYSAGITSTSATTASTIAPTEAASSTTLRAGATVAVTTSTGPTSATATLVTRTSSLTGSSSNPQARTTAQSLTEEEKRQKLESFLQSVKNLKPRLASKKGRRSPEVQDVSENSDLESNKVDNDDYDEKHEEHRVEEIAECLHGPIGLYRQQVKQSDQKDDVPNKSSATIIRPMDESHPIKDKNNCDGVFREKDTDNEQTHNTEIHIEELDDKHQQKEVIVKNDNGPQVANSTVTNEDENLTSLTSQSLMHPETSPLPSLSMAPTILPSSSSTTLQLEQAVSTLAKNQELRVKELLEAQAKQREVLRASFEEQQKQLIHKIVLSMRGNAGAEGEEDQSSALAATLSSSKQLLTRSLGTPDLKLNETTIGTSEKSVEEMVHKKGLDVGPEMHHKFCKLSALAKGYLTRRLLRTLKVESLIASIRDITSTALQLHKEADNGQVQREDLELHSRLVQQLNRDYNQVHELFFGVSTHQRMAIIAMDHEMRRNLERRRSSGDQQQPQLSRVTLQRLAQRRQIIATVDNNDDVTTVSSSTINVASQRRRRTRRSVSERPIRSARRSLYSSTQVVSTRNRIRVAASTSSGSLKRRPWR